MKSFRIVAIRLFNILACSRVGSGDGVAFRQVLARDHPVGPVLSDVAIDAERVSPRLDILRLEIDRRQVTDDNPDLFVVLTFPGRDAVLEAHQKETDEAADPKCQEQL